MTANSISNWFERARAQAARRHLVVIREDGQCLVLPALPTTSINPEMVIAIEQIIPSIRKRNVAVIGNTTWASSPSPGLQAAKDAIPFWGLLMGFTSIGHSVWVFHASANLLIAGCRDADVLIVDSASVVELPANWQSAAEKVMRNPQILIHDRASYKLLSIVHE